MTNLKTRTLSIEDYEGIVLYTGTDDDVVHAEADRLAKLGRAFSVACDATFEDGHEESCFVAEYDGQSWVDTWMDPLF